MDGRPNRRNKAAISNSAGSGSYLAKQPTGWFVMAYNELCCCSNDPPVSTKIFNTFWSLQSENKS